MDRSIKTIPNATLEHYQALLNSFLSFWDAMVRIPLSPHSRAADIEGPGWRNPDLPPLDALSLYCILCLKNPKNYVEIGSGSSTRFARQAISDCHLKTVITVCDKLPYPGDPINLLADRRRRAPLPQVSRTIVNTLEKGDILHVNTSTLPDQGMSVIIEEIIPNLPIGVFIQFRESPSGCEDTRGIEVFFPCADVSQDPGLCSILSPFWNEIGLGKDEGIGRSCWWIKNY